MECINRTFRTTKSQSLGRQQTVWRDVLTWRAQEFHWITTKMKHVFFGGWILINLLTYYLWYNVHTVYIYIYSEYIYICFQQFNLPAVVLFDDDFKVEANPPPDEYHRFKLLSVDGHEASGRAHKLFKYLQPRRLNWQDIWITQLKSWIRVWRDILKDAVGLVICITNIWTQSELCWPVKLVWFTMEVTQWYFHEHFSKSHLAGSWRAMFYKKNWWPKKANAFNITNGCAAMGATGTLIPWVHGNHVATGENCHGATVAERRRQTSGSAVVGKSKQSAGKRGIGGRLGRL